MKSTGINEEAAGRPGIMALIMLFTGVSALVAATSASASPSDSNRRLTTFRHVTLIDGLGGPPRANQTVVVENGQILKIGTTGDFDGARGLIIDGTGKYLLPGLIDSHVHLSGPLRVRTGAIDMLRRRAAQALASYLYLGFTTIGEMGNDPDVTLELRREERTGKLLSPHLLATGNLITSPGGKSHEIGIEVADKPLQLAKLQQHLRQKPDFAKLVYDEEGWSAQPLTSIWSPQALKAIISFYHRHGLRTIIHIASELRAREAIEAGVDALAHPVTTGEETEAFARLMSQRQIPFATTLTIRDGYSRLVEDPSYLDRDDYRMAFTPEERQALKTAVRDKYAKSPMTWWSKAMLPVIMANVRRIVDAGGIAALGTDQQSGPAAHREMQLLIEAGLTPTQVISAATYNAARLLGTADRTGSIEVGKTADLLLVDKDPLANIDNLEAIALVMKSGEIVDESRLDLPNGAAPRRFRGTS